jgi:adenylate cyclase
VRQLYEARLEPTLGGRLQDVTIMFTDIEGFTSVAERMPTDQVAVALGQYLEVMTQAIHATGGIIDKYIGDAVMALWNTPIALPQHPRAACEAALRCAEATGALFDSVAWGGLPAWHTRFGIHRAEVSVGHFGAPDRMSFTAMGDGVNLASRLEGLNKQYGTSILVSASVAREVYGDFVLRRLDRVAVKGKRDGIEVYELVGRAGLAVRTDVHAAYEAALEAYFTRRFEPALSLLAANADDWPSHVLADRCHRYLDSPPPSDWAGVYVSQEK